MTRSVEELEAELAVRHLEAQLASEKDEDGRGASNETKLALREARKTHRGHAQRTPVDDGDARVTPDPIDVTQKVETV